MTEVKEMTVSQEIIALLEQALAVSDAPAEAPPAPYNDPIRREQDEYDYDPPGYDPDADWEDDDHYPEELAEDNIDVADVAGQVDTVTAPVEPPAQPMIAAVLQENLKKALDVVVPYIPSYPPLPILANVLLETSDGCRLAISATDLETSITHWIGSKVELDGAITIDAKTLKELNSSLSRERVDFRVDSKTQTLHVRCGVQTAELRGIDADEYPVIKIVDEPFDFQIESEALLRMLNGVLNCVATEQNRPILTGVYFRWENDMLTLAGADGYRLGVERLTVAEKTAETRDAVIPGQALKKLMRVLRQRKDQEVGIRFPNDQTNSMAFVVPNILVQSQCLEGRFPDFASIIPRSCQTQVVLYAADTLIALKRAKIFAKDNGNSAYVSVVPARNPGEPAEVTIGARSPERGETKALLDATATGDRVEWSFNNKYMLEAIDHYRKEAERIVIDTNGPENPAVIRPEHQPVPSISETGSLTVIMPMSK